MDERAALYTAARWYYYDRPPKTDPHDEDDWYGRQGEPDDDEGPHAEEDANYVRGQFLREVLQEVEKVRPGMFPGTVATSP